MGTRYRRSATVRLGLQFGIPVAAGVVLAAVFPLVFSLSPAAWSPVTPRTVAGSIWAAQLWYSGIRTSTAELGGAPIRYLFGVANTVTVLRGGLFSIVAGVAVAAETPAVVATAGLCYGVGVVLDGIDGTLARWVGRETALGKRLDMTVDTVGFVVAPVAAVLWGLLPWWYLSLSAARYVFIGVRRWRHHRERTVYDTPENDLSRYLATIQMVFLTVVLLRLIPVATIQRVAPLVLAPSIAVFGRDILAISGWYPSSQSGSLYQ